MSEGDNEKEEISDTEATTNVCKYCGKEYEINDDHPDNYGYCSLCYYLLYLD